jgi:hypothetical protein
MHNYLLLYAFISGIHLEPTTPEDWSSWSLGGNTARIINECFRYKTVTEIKQALQNEGSEFSLKTLATLNIMSPTSLLVTNFNFRCIDLIAKKYLWKSRLH